MSLPVQKLFGLFAFLFLAHRLNANNFGANDQERANIIGGETVQQEHSLPMLVTININLTTKIELLGSGVIINKDWILTVGHLFSEFEEEDFANVLVGHGSLDRTKQSLVKVNHTYSSYFNLTTRQGDIAFLHVPNIGENVFTDTSLKIIIKDSTTLNSSAKLLLPGFGSTNSSQRHVASIVAKIATRLTLAPLSECKRLLVSHGKNQHVLISSSNICAANGHNETGSSPCYGDSGNPLFYSNFEYTNKSDYYLLGLLSWGENSCALNYPSVYTSLWAYRTIIQNITGFANWLPSQ